MIRVRWRDVFDRWHVRSYGYTRSGLSAMLTFLEDCAADPAVAAVAVETSIEDATFWQIVDEAMGFVGRDL